MMFCACNNQERSIRVSGDLNLDRILDGSRFWLRLIWRERWRLIKVQVPLILKMRLVYAQRLCEIFVENRVSFVCILDQGSHFGLSKSVIHIVKKVPTLCISQVGLICICRETNCYVIQGKQRMSIERLFEA